MSPDPCTGSPRSETRARSRRVAPVAALVAALLAAACAGTPKPQEACLDIDAASNLNFHDDQAHVVTLFVFPLSSTGGFQQTPVEELLAGASPPGVEGSPVHVSVSPGEQGRRFEDLFPAGTVYLGVVANYYRAPGDPEGRRSAVVPARCGWRTPDLTLAAKDVYQE